MTITDNACVEPQSPLTVGGGKEYGLNIATGNVGNVLARVIRNLVASADVPIPHIRRQNNASGIVPHLHLAGKVLSVGLSTPALCKGHPEQVLNNDRFRRRRIAKLVKSPSSAITTAPLIRMTTAINQFSNPDMDIKRIEWGGKPVEMDFSKGPVCQISDRDTIPKGENYGGNHAQ